MKTAAKVFIIIGMVVGFWMILPIIFGAITLKKLKTATKKEELTVWGVLTLLFCNMIGGILILCLKDSDLAPVSAEGAEAATEATPVDSDDNSSETL